MSRTRSLIFAAVVLGALASALRAQEDGAKIVDDATERAALALDHLHLEIALALVDRHVQLFELHRELDRGERVTQLVTEHREEFVLAAIGVLELRE